MDLKFDPNLITHVNIGNMPKQIGKGRYICRYMPLVSGFNMLFYNFIPFSRANNFYDKNECKYPLQTKYLKTDGTVFETTGQSFHDHAVKTNIERNHYFISCWSNSEDGCLDNAMWRTYADGWQKDGGMFVVFEKEQLLKEIRNGYLDHYDQLSIKDDIKGYGHVQYYSLEEFADKIACYDMVPHPAFYKRRQFSAEKEYRIILGSQQIRDPVNNIGLYTKKPLVKCGLVRVALSGTVLSTFKFILRGMMIHANLNEQYGEGFERASFGYNCADKKELYEALRLIYGYHGKRQYQSGETPSEKNLFDIDTVESASENKIGYFTRLDRKL